MERSDRPWLAADNAATPKTEPPKAPGEKAEERPDDAPVAGVPEAAELPAVDAQDAAAESRQFEELERETTQPIRAYGFDSPSAYAIDPIRIAEAVSYEAPHVPEPVPVADAETPADVEAAPIAEPDAPEPTLEPFAPWIDPREATRPPHTPDAQEPELPEPIAPAPPPEPEAVASAEPPAADEAPAEPTYFSEPVRLDVPALVEPTVTWPQPEPAPTRPPASPAAAQAPIYPAPAAEYAPHAQYAPQAQHAPSLPAEEVRPAARDWRDIVRRAATAAFLVGCGWFIATLLLIVAYRFVNPPYSMLMALQWMSGTRIQQQWVPLERVSPNLTRAVVVAEDGRFCQHWGVDFIEAAKAIQRAADGYPRGASTITMQVAKNLFLVPAKSYLRKMVEIPLTFAIELAWPKRRILEVYLNIVEWGPGIFGAEAASQAHFGRSAMGLSARQAAQLAVSLPNPIVRDAGDPGPRTAYRASVIQARAARSREATSCVEGRR
jgi:monofunctional biosynthetic peptidoglycan transglycosylase